MHIDCGICVRRVQRAQLHESTCGTDESTCGTEESTCGTEEGTRKKQKTNRSVAKALLTIHVIIVIDYNRAYAFECREHE
jgi:hypothetical protein